MRQRIAQVAYCALLTGLAILYATTRPSRDDRNLPANCAHCGGQLEDLGGGVHRCKGCRTATTRK
ncbi:hypothetical protein [Streptomyces abyssalis]|uniref:hypothetical protein n=1 Tax=Streptomyces abyssalis TaxID=933944 RepID=UPI001112D76F|nr:hypothetical protein [Streptomyces abyssalis]